MQNSPTMRMMRELQAQSDRFSAVTGLASDFSGGLPARIALHDYNRITAVGALAGNLANGFSDIAKRSGLLDPAVLSALNGPLSAVTRANQWATHLNDSGVGKLAAVIGAQSALLGDVERVRQAAIGIVRGWSHNDRVRLSETLGLAQSLSSEFEQTRLKLSAFAGAGEVLGFGATTSFSAFDKLFGSWHTLPNLPVRFWRDPASRRRRYAEAEVDGGLIEATPAAISASRCKSVDWSAVETRM